jgi:hypothetical protein
VESDSTGLLVVVSIVLVPENSVLLDDGVRFEVSDDGGSEFDELPVIIDSVEPVLLSLNKVGVLFGSVEVTDPVLLKVEVSDIPVDDKVVVRSEIVLVNNPFVVVCSALNVVDLSFVVVVDASFILRKQ